MILKGIEWSGLLPLLSHKFTYPFVHNLFLYTSLLSSMGQKGKNKREKRENADRRLALQDAVTRKIRVIIKKK